MERDRRWRDELARWPISLVLDGVCFCHGSPRRDDEILTRLTPDDVLLDAVSGVAEPLIVGSHTHQQVVRTLNYGSAYANAGSVGMPYEGRPGAFWMVVDDGEPHLHQTAYDIRAAVEELRASGFPDTDEQLRESLLEPVDADWVAAFFERAAGRAVALAESHRGQGATR